jgi:hypothetical protein
VNNHTRYNCHDSSDYDGHENGSDALVNVWDAIGELAEIPSFTITPGGWACTGEAGCTFGHVTVEAAAAGYLELVVEAHV